MRGNIVTRGTLRKLSFFTVLVPYCSNDGSHGVPIERSSPTDPLHCTLVHCAGCSCSRSITSLCHLPYLQICWFCFLSPQYLANAQMQDKRSTHPITWRMVRRCNTAVKRLISSFCRPVHLRRCWHGPPSRTVFSQQGGQNAEGLCKVCVSKPCRILLARFIVRTGEAVFVQWGR